MAEGLPTLGPLWRSGLRIWLAATLTIGILLWSGRSHVLAVGLVMAVALVSDGAPLPPRSIAALIGGALIGILTAFVLHELSTSWVMLGLALLATGVLIRALGLLQGLATGYLGSWALDLMHRGNQVNWALIFNLAFAAVVGILMAQLATRTLWPQRPLQQLPAIEEALAQQLAGQIRSMRQWLCAGGPPPAALRSQELLPRIELLQQGPKPRHQLQRRWNQAGTVWRQLLRQWLLLEPLLRQLPAPLPAHGPDALVLSTLRELADSLAAPAGPSPPASPPATLHTPHQANAELWLRQASLLAAPKPLLLAIGQQCQALGQLVHGRRLLHRALLRLSAAGR